MKINNSGTGVDRIGNRGGILFIENVSLKRLIAVAFNVPEWRNYLFSGPDWLCDLGHPTEGDIATGLSWRLLLFPGGIFGLSNVCRNIESLPAAAAITEAASAWRQSNPEPSKPAVESMSSREHAERYNRLKISSLPKLDELHTRFPRLGATEGGDSVEAWAFGGNHDEMVRQRRLQNTSETATD